MPCWRGVLMHTIFVSAQPLYLTIRQLWNSNYLSSMSTSWLAITAMSYIYITTQLSLPFFRSPLRHLPSPPGDTFPIGHLNFNGGKPPTDIFADMLKNTPNDGLIVLWFPLYLHCQLIPTRPNALMEMMNVHSYDWIKPADSKRLIKLILGEGLVNVEGNQHKAMRRVVAPAFSGQNINELVPLFYSKGLDFVESLARKVRKSADGTLEVMDQFSRVTLDIIGAAGVGKDFNTVENDDNRLAKLYATIIDPNQTTLSLMSFVLVDFFVPAPLVKYCKGSLAAKIVNASAELHQETLALIKEKRLSMQDKAESQKDIIARVMSSGDFSDGYLVDQLLTFLAAGHDTTASALTWVSWLLCLHPEIQDRLRTECETHLANKSPSEIDSSVFSPETMPLLAAVCNETLRLYPTVPATGRKAGNDTTIGTQFVPKGTGAVMAPWAINRDKDLWGADADDFKPDRWLEGPNAAHGGAKNAYSFITFLHGPRGCIGQSFARAEMKCLLVAFIMRFRLELANPDEKVEVGGFLTIKPRNGLKLKLHDLSEKSETATGSN